jgi:hypothetical protein
MVLGPPRLLQLGEQPPPIRLLPHSKAILQQVREGLIVSISPVINHIWENANFRILTKSDNAAYVLYLYLLRMERRPSVHPIYQRPTA